ncbi:MAG: peptide chain release factor-like protein [Verrucomicrobiae bacterium]|nr:peptide chain release factor-like protein [Verrucomicrobiae bacterium]
MIGLSVETFEARCAKLGLRLGDFAETFSRSSGPGGQNVNKVSTSVTMRHGPSGLTVTVRESRSQALNRAIARQRILRAVVHRMHMAALRLRMDLEKVRRQNRPRPRGLKRRLVESKRRRSVVKLGRGRVHAE